MATFRRLDVLRAIEETGLVPVFYHGEALAALDVACACGRGGARVVEFTHRGDFAHCVFEELSRARNEKFPDVALGVGSIRDAGTAALYLALGADFIVSSSLQPAVAALCNGRKVAYIAGGATPTEVARAEELGCEIVKVFPGDGVGGPDFIRSIRGPSPWSSLMPTGGVLLTAESIREWITAGAVAVGIGSGLVSREILENKDYDQLAVNVSQALRWVEEART